MRADQRSWIIEFLNRFSTVLANELQLRAEMFLQVKVIEGELSRRFQASANQFVPMMGLGLQPGEALPPIPTSDDFQPIVEGKVKFDFRKSIGDYCFWFLDKSGPQQREMFWGTGGMLTLYLKPDPKTIPPKLPFSERNRKHAVFQAMNVDALFASMYSLMDSFPPRSKELFGGKLKDDPQFSGLLFITPLLSTHHFFQRPDEEIKSWFDLFEVYVSESPRDRGILIASKSDLDEPLIRVLNSMRENGLVYPGHASRV